MANFGLISTVLAKILTASFIVERFLEYLDTVWQVFGVSTGQTGLIAKLLGIQTTLGQEEKRRRNKRVLMQTAGVGLGIILCYFNRLGVFSELGVITQPPIPLWDMVLTGILISGGSEPIHQLIRFIVEHKEYLKTQPPEAPLAKAERTSTFPILGIDYRGDAVPEKPGHGLRRNNPRFIVVHHTGRDDIITFEQLYQLEKMGHQGKFTKFPSFHAVIERSGVYHEYCRWNSTGWHISRTAQVSNGNSLALCFLGDLEQQSPSQAQLESGARVVALWRLLYGIPAEQVLPHYLVNKGQTTCPGKTFPWQRFMTLVERYVQLWKNDSAAQKELQRFKKRPFLLVGTKNGKRKYD